MQGLHYSEENYSKKVKSAYPDDYNEVLKLYPYSSERKYSENYPLSGPQSIDRGYFRLSAVKVDVGVY